MSIDHLGFNIYQISWEILNCQDTDSENQKKLNLIVLLEEKTRDHQSQWISSPEEHDGLHKMFIW